MDGIFERNTGYAYARAAEVMSTQSETDFEWSVKLIGNSYFYVGIASQLKRVDSYIWTYDQNAITFFSNGNLAPFIRIGSKQVHTYRCKKAEISSSSDFNLKGKSLLSIW